MKMMESRPQHWSSDPHAYSLEDLILAKNGALVGEVKKITKLCINHIAKCQVLYIVYLPGCNSEEVTLTCSVSSPESIKYT